MKYSATFLPLLALVALLAPHVMAGAEDGGSVQKPGYLGDKDGGYYDGDKDKHYDHKDYDKNYDHKDDDKKDYDRKDNDKDYDHKDYDHKDYDHKDYDAHDSGYSGEHGHDKYKTQVLWGQCDGSGYKGPRKCPEGAYCKWFSEWYSQCNPSDH